MNEPPEINLTLFNHILNDAHTNDFYFSGSSWKESLEYFSHYLKKADVNLPEAAKESFLILQGQLSDLIEQERDLIDLCNIYSGLQKSKIEQQSQKWRQLILRRLRAKKGLFLIGGWTNIDRPGHAALWEIKPRSDTECVFLLHNVGGGLSYHSTMMGPNQQHYSPVKAWVCPLPLDEKILNDFIYGLLLVCLPNAKERSTTMPSVIDEEYYYTNIVPNIAHLKGREIPPDSIVPTNQWIAGARGKSCTPSVLTELLHRHFPDPSVWQRFHFQFKLYALKDYLASKIVPLSQKQAFLKALENETSLESLTQFFTPMEMYERDQILLAIRGMFLDLQNLPTSDQIKPARLLQRLKESIEKISLKPEPMPLAPHLGSNKPFQLEARVVQAASSTQNIQDLDPRKLTECNQFFSVDPQNDYFHIDAVKTFVKHCEQLMKFNRSQEVVDLIERFLKQLPLPLVAN